jgi:hypothetical protein
VPFDIRREIGVPDRGDGKNDRPNVTRGMVSGSIGWGVRPRRADSDCLRRTAFAYSESRAKRRSDGHKER